MRTSDGMLAVNEFRVRFFPKLNHHELTSEEIETWLNNLHKGGWSVTLINIQVRKDDGATLVVAKRWRNENKNMPVRSLNDNPEEEDIV